MISVVGKGRPRLEAAKRIVIKVGSALLVQAASGTLNRAWLESLATDITLCRSRGQEVIVVSSGAIAIGRRILKMHKGPLKLEEKQAAASVGMVHIAHAYQEILGQHDLSVAQILLTIGDTEDRRRYINARNTLEQLLSLGAIPLINENDTVATDEIRFGDNDRLAGRVSAMVGADVLLLLSDIDGLYSADPRTDYTAGHVHEVVEITAKIEAMAGTVVRGDGSGGMITKISAAKVAVQAGCHMVIFDGTDNKPLSRLENGARCTWFLSSATPHTARKRWIAGALQTTGAIVVDDGALSALQKGRSLLSAGVTDVEDEFERGDSVIIKSSDGTEVARGLVAYSAADARRIIGHKSGEIEELLGYRGRDEMIHRDDLA
ncbi:MAG: glutamate 5-kinase, partial [Rhodospirillales bacterium]